MFSYSVFDADYEFRVCFSKKIDLGLDKPRKVRVKKKIFFRNQHQKLFYNSYLV